MEVRGQFHIPALGGIIGVHYFCSYTTASRRALGPTQPPIQWVPGTLSLGVKRQGREADHSPPSSAEVKERVKLYLHSPNTSPWRGAQLKHRDNFAFTFYKFRMYILQIDKRRAPGFHNDIFTHFRKKYLPVEQQSAEETKIKDLTVMTTGSISPSPQYADNTRKYYHKLQ
jgi:hypothetical protein